MFRLIDDIGIDLGTANIRVFVPGKGIVLREPSVVAVSLPDKNVLAIGERAREMLGRTPGNMQAVRPIVDGAIADFTYAQKMLEFILHRVCGFNRFLKPRVVIAIPSGNTSVQRRAVRQAALGAGARIALLVEKPKAAALGSSLPIAAPGGNLVVDLGAGMSDAAVLSLNGVVLGRSIDVGGNRLDDAIVRYLKTVHNLSVGAQTASEVKNTIGTALPLTKELRTEVKGRDLVTGLPRTVDVTSDEIRAAMADCINQIIDRIKSVLAGTPPELASDIIERGITLTGGVALLRDLDQLIAERIWVPVRVADDPFDCVALGIGKMLEQGYDLREDIAIPAEPAAI
ncbi:MAG: rod shape-determining protein [Capsulimonadaceae bacterium]|nr:rod shape-determining protein [Capsulimonadaceae bacterium]